MTSKWQSSGNGIAPKAAAGMTVVALVQTRSRRAPEDIVW